RASALRILIHLIGDIHQPLHAIANGDRGGNCVPVTYFGQAPQADANGSYSPNLHGIWDSQSVTRLMRAVGAATPSALATNLDLQASPSKIQAQMPSTTRVLAWAKQSNAAARSTSYGKLPKAVTIEPASQFTIASCDDNNHVAQRMAALNEVLGTAYDSAVRPVVRT
ncbi:MAG TPA: S1/P1 nuclease, partial [Vicinamibacterales bacterium]|nr:S1/P1 nuclease [Vicinamibacterales bacterium]